MGVIGLLPWRVKDNAIGFIEGGRVVTKAKEGPKERNQYVRGEVVSTAL